MSTITTILGTDQATNSRAVINTNFSNLNTDKYQSGDAAVFSSAQITGLTASRILATDASSNIQALSTSTYPSLTELSYLKGATSAIQTQMDLKSPLASPTFSGAVGIGAAASGNASRLYVANATHSSGVLSQFNLTQTTINASDTGDAIMSAYYTLSASSATNQLVSRGIQFAMSNGLTGGGILSNARGINITYTTAASTTTTNWDAIYIDSGTASGTVTTGRGLVIAGLQGTTKYGIYDAVGTKWVSATGGQVGIGNLAPATSLDIQTVTATENVGQTIKLGDRSYLTQLSVNSLLYISSNLYFDGSNFRTKVNAAGTVLNLTTVGLEFYSGTNGGVDGVSTATMTFAVQGALGSVICGKQAALATNATDGFTYIPTSAGTPTGVPTAYTGKVAMEYDTTNNKLYVYNGAWKSVTLA